MLDILVFGTGSGYQKIKDYIDNKKVNIMAYVDNNEGKKDSTFEGKPVISPDEVEHYKYDYIFIASTFHKEITGQLIGQGVKAEMIFCYYDFDNLEFETLELIFRGEIREVKDFFFKGQKLKLFCHEHNCGHTGKRMTERALELAIADYWLNNLASNAVIEVGAVSPYYWPGRIKDIVDPVDSHKYVNIRESILDIDLKDQYVLSISTIEHIGLGDYGLNEDQDSCITAFHKILTESKKCLITVPIGYNKHLDKYLRSFKPDINVGISVYKRGINDNNWKLYHYLEEICDIDYGPLWANGVIFIEKS